jgi:hypothetical protein
MLMYIGVIIQGHEKHALSEFIYCNAVVLTNPLPLPRYASITRYQRFR